MSFFLVGKYGDKSKYANPYVNTSLYSIQFINPLVPNIKFLRTLKTQETARFSAVFRYKWVKKAKVEKTMKRKPKTRYIKSFHKEIERTYFVGKRTSFAETTSRRLKKRNTNLGQLTVIWNVIFEKINLVKLSFLVKHLWSTSCAIFV